MGKSVKKRDFPVSQIRRYLEPGPIVLVSSKWKDKANVMTMGWHTVMEFTLSLVGCVIASGNHSFEIIRRSRECVINLPTTALTEVVVKIGNTSGADIDKFETFGLTREAGHEVDAPLIGECHASFECRLHDDALVDTLQLLHLQGGEGARRGVAEAPRNASLHRGRGVHGVRQDRQSKIAVTAGDVVMAGLQSRGIARIGSRRRLTLTA